MKATKRAVTNTKGRKAFALRRASLLGLALGISIAKTADDREQSGKGENENHKADKCVHVPNDTRHVRYSPSDADIAVMIGQATMTAKPLGDDPASFSAV